MRISRKPREPHRGPSDATRWKFDDGRYEVIYGDLRAETVTAEQLRALQGK
jgi:hypothetical protein